MELRSHLQHLPRTIGNYEYEVGVGLGDFLNLELERRRVGIVSAACHPFESAPLDDLPEGLRSPRPTDVFGKEGSDPGRLHGSDEPVAEGLRDREISSLPGPYRVGVRRQIMILRRRRADDERTRIHPRSGGRS